MSADQWTTAVILSGLPLNVYMLWNLVEYVQRVTS